jgi:hypothetical protein
MRTYAELLEQKEMAGLLQETLDEKKGADETLSNIVSSQHKQDSGEVALSVITTMRRPPMIRAPSLSHRVSQTQLTVSSESRQHRIVHECRG